MFISNIFENKIRPFTVIDIKRELEANFHSNYSETLTRRYLKHDLKLSYWKSTTKSNNVDLCKLRIIRMIFWYRISKVIDENTLLELDGLSLNCDISNDKGWFKMNQRADIFSKRSKGLWSLILAITSLGDYYELELSKR